MSRPGTDPGPLSPVARGVISVASFVVAGSLLMLLFVHPGTAEFVITVTTLCIGLGMGLIAVPVIRSHRRNTFH
ncbi:hypothetical protein GCM10009841_11310 [Microlunatus panaciterrae]|uniref:Uncharacterized protein n=1 Tax=Microlunatus panaciterrae TaxID=400768 RepID=A0ABS2RLU2_9ACTN|nr:hypothetical protein [Microlunatus panaciterrae]MBM7799688.1 hypothetical protein [Microlunatus panaciterrae]